MSGHAVAPLRFDGKLKSWNDARGFGFIEPARGGQDIFVHIKAFSAGTSRPALGVRRISVGGALAGAAWTGFMDAARLLVDDGTFDGFKPSPGRELNALFKAAGSGNGG